MGKADYDFVALNSSQVMATSGGVSRFADSWPCSGMRLDGDYGVIFSFAANGDLVDIEWFDGETGLDITEPEGINGEALAALSHDAQDYLNALV